jgi:hypothetical protein
MIDSILSRRDLLEYVYLDVPGIESLYAQLADDLETSRVRTTQKGVAAKAATGVKLRNFVMKLLAGLEGELSAEISGSGTITEQTTRVLSIENKLARVRAFLGDKAGGLIFRDLGEASRYLQKAGGKVFVDVRDEFNAPQFYGGAGGAASVTTEGYLLLEKGGASDYRDQDDYYRRPSAELTVLANVNKMRCGSVMGSSSHDAHFFRKCGGRRILLNVFGSLAGNSEFLQLKPFAIWR